MAPVKNRMSVSARCEELKVWLLPSALLPPKRMKPGRGRKRCKSTRIYKERIDPRVEFPRPRDFEARYRLPPDMVEKLAEEFEASPFCDTKGSGRGRPIPVFNKVCYALRFLATGASFKVIRDTQGGCSSSSVSRAVRQFVKFLVYKSRTGVISFPKKDDLHESAIRFCQRFNMEDCIGCMDGTHVPIRRPEKNEGSYVNRHYYHSLNCLLVTDHEQRFTFVETSMAGSNHDQYILEHSTFGAEILGTDRLGDYFLLGDSGYGLNPQVLTPFKHQTIQTLPRHELKYQMQHISARNSVERAIGQLKMRWRCLSKQGGGVLEFDPLRASWVVEACCTLHNLCIDWGVRTIRPGENKDPDMEDLIQEEARLRILLSMRQAERARRTEGASGDPQLRQNTKSALYREGFAKRARYIFRNYGGPRPTLRQRRRR